MVYVRLDSEWTDGSGTTHQAGEMVDVDAATLAQLEAEGIVHSDSTEWAGPTGGKDGAEWAGPTDQKSWAGPTTTHP